MVATLKGFPFHWKTGADNLLLVSVGTGMGRLNRLPKNISDNNLLNWAQQIPDMFMQDASWHNQAILQWLSKSPTAWEIDGEIGDLQDDLLGGDSNGKGVLSYLRYNMWIDEKNLGDIMKRPYTKPEIDGLTEMSNAASRFELNKIGKAGADVQVKAEHFPENFKLKK